MRQQAEGSVRLVAKVSCQDGWEADKPPAARQLRCGGLPGCGGLLLPSWFKKFCSQDAFFDVVAQRAAWASLREKLRLVSRRR